MSLLNKIGGRLTRYLNDIRNLVAIRSLDPVSAPAFRPDINSPVIVCLTSFPARIDNVWITIESLFRQTYRPSKIILVLSKDEFSSDAELPEALRAQTKRGLTILWSEGNIRSYKKLIPVRMTFPHHVIVTVDDDVFYHPDMLERLIVAHKNSPGHIIGNFGRIFPGAPVEAHPYTSWPAASQSTPSDNVFLIGIGGILYPPNLLPEPLLCDVELAEQLCPTADDIWFWAVSVVSGVERACLAARPYRELAVMRGAPRLSTVNRDGFGNDYQLKRVMEYFGLGR